MNDTAMRLTTLLLIPAMALAPTPGASQGPSVSSPAPHKESPFGGYFSTDARVGPVKDVAGVFVGGEFVLLIDHRYAVGVAGYGLANDRATVDTPSGAKRLTMGYGGLKVGYVARASARLHPTVDLLLGDGEVSARHDATEDADVFVIEPTVGVEAVLARHARLAAGVGYRWLSEVGFPNVQASDLRGVVAHLGLRLGWF